MPRATSTGPPEGSLLKEAPRPASYSRGEPRNDKERASWPSNSIPTGAKNSWEGGTALGQAWLSHTPTFKMQMSPGGQHIKSLVFSGVDHAEYSVRPEKTEKHGGAE